MATKRPLEDLQIGGARPRRDNVKRTKLSPSGDRRSNSSSLSHGSVSEDSALQSSDLGSESHPVSSVSSLDSLEDDNEETSGDSSSTMSAGESSSEEGTDSDSDSEADEDAEQIVTIGGPKKPRMDHTKVLGGAQDLRSRLAAFLPQMQKANGLLRNHDKMEKDDDSGDDENGEQHIEMNLGLGVLEEQRDSDKEEDSDIDVPTGSDRSSSEQKSRQQSKAVNGKEDEDVMGKLLGQKSAEKRVGIEEVG